MKFSVGCSLIYHVPAPMPFVFNVEAASFSGQAIQNEQLSLDPALAVERWTMPEVGNRYLRISAQAGDLRLRCEAEVILEPLLENPEAVSEVPAAELPFEVMAYLYPSRYCQSDKLVRFAHSTFGNLAAGYRRVNGICNWIRDNVEYQSGISDSLTSAFDTVTERAGRVPGFCPFDDRVVPRPGDSRPLRKRLCVASGAARFSRSGRGLSARAVRYRMVSVRSDQDGRGRRTRAHWHRPRCGRCGILLALWRCRL
jgi:hypothetical protein